MKLLKSLTLAAMLVPMQAHALYSASDITDWSQVNCDKTAVYAATSFKFYLKGSTLRELYPVMGKALVEDNQVSVQTMRASYAYLNQGVEALEGNPVTNVDDVTLSFLQAVRKNCLSMKKFY